MTTRLTRFFLFLLLASLPLGVTAQESDRYVFKEGDYNGIGKWYMGREIAYVMSYQGMSWLDRPEREKEERTSLLIKNMNLKTTDVVADIGAGSGYHVFKMAPLVAEGTVYAVDIQYEMLTAIKEKQQLNDVDNVITIKGTETSVNLPKNSIDKVLMVDVYHEFNYPYEVMMSIKKALKPNGKIYLIEYRAEDSSVPILKLHKLSEEQSIIEMKAAGFTLEQNLDNLPWQHCMIFVKSKL